MVRLDIDGLGGRPLGDAGGQLDGTYPNPDVIGIVETSGPTHLTIGSILDGELLIRSGNTITSQSAIAPSAHSFTHEDGGTDEINVTGLSGLLADAQTPSTHASTHEDGGADEISVTGLSGLLADPQVPTTHSGTHHVGGTDELIVQLLGSNGAAAGLHLQADGAGGWTLVVPATTVSGIKSGNVVPAAFSGNPKTTTVTFSTAFPDTNYAVTLDVSTTGNASYLPTIENKLSGSFGVNLQSNNISKLTELHWHAIRHAEQ